MRRRLGSGRVDARRSASGSSPPPQLGGSGSAPFGSARIGSDRRSSGWRAELDVFWRTRTRAAWLPLWLLGGGGGGARAAHCT